MTSKYVKLYLYEELPEKTLISTFEAEEFSQFLLIRVSDEALGINEFMNELSEIVRGLGHEKRVLVLSDKIDFKIYGIEKYKEDFDNDNDGSACRELQHEGSAEEIS